MSLQGSTQEIGEEIVNGDTDSLSSSQGQVHHATNKGQPRSLVIVASLVLAPSPDPSVCRVSPASAFGPSLQDSTWSTELNVQ